MDIVRRTFLLSFILMILLLLSCAFMQMIGVRNSETIAVVIISVAVVGSALLTWYYWRGVIKKK